MVVCPGRRRGRISGRMDYRILISHQRGQERMVIQARMWASGTGVWTALDDEVE